MAGQGEAGLVFILVCCIPALSYKASKDKEAEKEIELMQTRLEDSQYPKYHYYMEEKWELK